MRVSAPLRLSVLALVALAVLLALPARTGAAPATVSHDTPFDFTVVNSCTGEDVHVIGVGHTVDQFTILPTGKIHLLHQESVADILAIGLTSGTVYNPTGQPAQTVFNYSPATDSGPFSFHNRQLFIAHGGADDFHLVESFHVEKTPNGDFVVVRDRFSIKCRG